MPWTRARPYRPKLKHGGWLAVLSLNAMILAVPLAVGMYEIYDRRGGGDR